MKYWEEIVVTAHSKPRKDQCGVFVVVDRTQLLYRCRVFLERGAHARIATGVGGHSLAAIQDAGAKVTLQKLNEAVETMVLATLSRLVGSLK